MSRQRIAITGSSGLVGGALSAYLRERGDDVVRLVRRHPVPPYEARLPGHAGSSSEIERLAETLSGVDAVVNLAGAGVADHWWTTQYKKTLWTSRVETTRSVVAALSILERPVVLVSGSAIGIYGDRGEEVLDESSLGGSGFLADLCRAWESEAAQAQSAGHRVVSARTGLVVSSRGGAFQRLALATKVGLGGPLGSGRQWWSWISLRDEVRAIAHLLDHEVVGPVNLVSPRASRQRDLAAALGRSMRRPAVTPAPALALRTVLGEMSGQVLTSARVHPDVLEQNGFRWQDANQDQVLDRLVADLTRRATA